MLGEMSTGSFAVPEGWWSEGERVRHPRGGWSSPLEEADSDRADADRAEPDQADFDRAPTDRADSDGAFVRALRSLWLAYQPIVRARDGAPLAHEALVRSDEPALGDPVALFDAAGRRSRRRRLSRAIRARLSADLASFPGDVFTNLGPEDLEDEALYDRRGPLAPFARRVVLEITEQAPLDRVPDLTGRIARLRDLGYRLAVDDLGAGYSGHVSLAILEPEIVKLDMSLVRGVDRDPARREVVRSTARLCRRLGSLVVAEGVETTAERDTLVELGCDALQGYFFARPSRLPLPFT
jgi:EAL domain-containing protein (putative c-di-GMP-specific phosphodiesterase class I)